MFFLLNSNGASSFNPNSVAGLQAWALTTAPYYYSSTLDGYEILAPKESYGSLRAPRQGRSVDFDGTDDFGKFATQITLSGDFTVCARINPDNYTGGTVFGQNAAGNAYLRVQSTSVVYRTTSNTTLTTGAVFPTGTTTHFAFKKSGTTGTVYADGVPIVSGTLAAGDFVIGQIGGFTNVPSNPFDGKMSDVRVYSSAKSDVEVAAIAAGDIANPDTTGLVAGYWCNEEAGTVGYDWSGNGNHLTLTNITASTFHATDTGVTANAANSLGHSNAVMLDGSTSYGQLPIPFGSPSAYTICGWFSGTRASAAGDFIFDTRDAGNDGVYIQLKLTTGVVTVGHNATTLDTAGVYENNGWHFFAVTWDGTTLTSNMNGGAEIVSTAVATAISTTTNMRIGTRAFSTVFQNFLGDIGGISVYTVAKTAPQIASLYAGTADTSGAMVIYPMNEGSGTNLVDTVAGNNATLTSMITPYWKFIPRNEALPTKDVTGAAIKYTGQCPYPMTIETPCITGDGVSVYVALGSLGTITSFEFGVKQSGTNQVLATLANSALTAITVVAGVLTFGASLTVSSIEVDDVVVSAATAGATLNDLAWHKVKLTLSAISASDVRLMTNSSTYTSSQFVNVESLSSGVITYIPLQDGAGTSNNNRNISYVKSDNTYGVIANALVNGTVSTIWGTLTNGVNQDWSVNYGGRFSTQNRLKYSDEFDNAIWLKTATTVTPNTTTAPDGELTADSIVLGAGTLSKHIAYSLTPTATVTFVVYAKADTHSYIQMICSGSSTHFANFDLATGVVGTKGANTTSSITLMPNGFYRCAATFASGVTFGGAIRIYGVTNASATYAQTTSATGTFYLWRGRLIDGADDYVSSMLVDQRTEAGAISAGQFIPAATDSSICADGMLPQLAAGKLGNPYSRLNMNPFTAAEFNGLAVQTSYEDLPCITGDGSTVYANLTAFKDLVSITGDFSGEAYIYLPIVTTTQNIIGGATSATNRFAVTVATGILRVGAYNGAWTAKSASVVVDTWYKLTWSYNSGTHTMTATLNDAAMVGVLSPAGSGSAAALRLLSSSSGASFCSGRISNFSLTRAGETTLFPLTSGSGVDLAWYKSDDTTGVVTTALLGTLTNVWANKNNGSIVPATKYSQRAIVPRDTKFNGVATTGDNRFLIYRDALTGADLTNVTTYIS